MPSLPIGALTLADFSPSLGSPHNTTATENHEGGGTLELDNECAKRKRDYAVKRRSVPSLPIAALTLGDFSPSLGSPHKTMKSENCEGRARLGLDDGCA
ncbi:hypothetical protein L2E82_51397 [Cichorium intybus]|nr:hypothetical protein L2E82_51397 [Cichorium intybus]